MRSSSDRVENVLDRIQRGEVNRHSCEPLVERSVRKEEEEIIEDRILVEEETANYFKMIYKIPEHMREEPIIDEEMKGGESNEEIMNIDTTSEIFRLADIKEAIKCSNFSKGLGPDCFDGNILYAS